MDSTGVTVFTTSNRDGHTHKVVAILDDDDDVQDDDNDRWLAKSIDLLQ